MKSVIIGTIVAVSLATMWHVDPVAQSPCLHASGEDAAQRARRTAALRLVRAINTAEVNDAFRKTNQYRPLADLPVDMSTAPGFEPHFTTDGSTYAFMLVDSIDTCRFAFSTNQNGVIFQGYPIDYEIQPLKR